MTAVHPRPTLDLDAFRRRSAAWAARIAERPITCPSGSALYREQLLRDLAERALADLNENTTADAALDLLPRWRKWGRLLAQLDADLRHAIECEGGLTNDSETL